jgi:WD40 repeat protein
VAFSHDGRRICTTHGSDALVIWDAVTGQAFLALEGQFSGLPSFSPDDQRILTIDSNEAVMFAAANGDRIAALKGPNATSACFSPDGQRIATAIGTAITVWDTVTARELLTLRNQKSPITSLAFSPDNQRILAACEDGTTRVLEAASAAQVARWRQEQQAHATIEER